MQFKTTTVDGLNVFYREAGRETAPKLVLLHGFPASSHQYRNLKGPTAGMPRQSSALWSLPRTGGASRDSLPHVQCHGGANERLQRLFVNFVALMKIDRAPHIAFEAGVEKA